MSYTIYNTSDLTNFLSGNYSIGYIQNNIGIPTNLKTLNSSKLLLNNTQQKINIIKSDIPDEVFMDFDVNKDMGYNSYTYEFDPYSYQDTLFPDLVDFIDENIVAGDKSSEVRLTACYWRDLGNDVFDDWGFFYLYDVLSGKYYFPLLTPLNQNDGVLTTQTFSAFERTFTIVHGWATYGVFKMKITVNDSLPFRFGAYGNMGSDGDEEVFDLTYPYTKNGNNLTLYYRKDAEESDNYEILYSYLIPIKVSENNEKKYDVYYNSDDMSLISKPVTEGLYVYFAKTNDAKNFVINNLVL